MRKNSFGRYSSIAACVVALGVTTVGCSSGSHDAAPTPTATTQHAGSGKAPGPNAIEISPAGVTTMINVPAESTEEQYAQACRAAREWMDSQGGDPHGQIEPLLKNVQASTVSSPVTFNSVWPKLSTAQQSAVIVAVRAASDGGC